MVFPSRIDYEALIYNLPGQYAAEITASTLRLYSTSVLTAKVEGMLRFANGFELWVKEFLDLRRGKILDYSYVVYRAGERIRWYDPQPHPELSALATTFPHHYHEQPDIKHNRQSAPGISFTAPNLPVLIGDCLRLG